jgi:hypothetical protein
MHSTKVILAPDYPLRGTVRPQFSRKRHLGSGIRAFQPRIDSNAPIRARKWPYLATMQGCFPESVCQGMSRMFPGRISGSAIRDRLSGTPGGGDLRCIQQRSF